MSEQAADRGTIHRIESAADVMALRRRLRFVDRPDRLRIGGRGVTDDEARRLSRDMTACGCFSGGLASLTFLVLLAVFARGDLSFARAGLWLGTIVGATFGAKMLALFVTYLRARWMLSRLERRLGRIVPQPLSFMGEI